MSEFNLIPEEYHRAVRQRRLMLIGISAVIAVVVLCLGSIGGAYYLLDQREAELIVLRQQKALSVQQQDRLTYLQGQKQKLESDLRLLSSLQSPMAVADVVLAVENAARPAGVHFQSWAFRRAGIRTADDLEVRPPSYYVLSEEKTFPASWESLTHVTIFGEARDHAALSTFVQSLFEQQDIEDVRIQRSARNEHGVEFQLAVVMATKVGDA